MPASRAVILIRLDGPDQQQQACLDHIGRHGYIVDSLTFHGADAAALVESGIAALVVTAYDDDTDADLIRRLEAAGGRLEYVRPPRRTRRTVGDEDLAVGMHRRGASLPAIAELLGVHVREVAAILRRAGVQTQP